MNPARLYFIFPALLTLAPLASADNSDGVKAPAFSRADAATIVGNLQKIVSPQGIDELVKIPIGGTEQWISVRGRDRRNPILLFLHGGPAAVEMPTSWTFQPDWEDFFTVVQWDQRGAGKTYNANDPEKIRPTLTIERMDQDAVAVVQYLRSHYHQDKIFVLGHSWGTVLGMRLALEHPDWLYAYVGMGQIINMDAGEKLGYEATLQAAEAAHNVQAVRDLESIAPYPEADGRLPLAKINLERQWSVYFGGLTYNRDSYDYYFHAARLSPEYSDADLAAIDKGSGLTLPTLLPELAKVDFSGNTTLHCPIFMFVGRHDETTPPEPVVSWFKDLQAPAKTLVWFENSAHMMQIEQPGLVLMHLVEDVRPLAGRPVPDSDKSEQ